MELDPAYRVAFSDWLACASGGSAAPAVRAARRAEPADQVFALATAGHILDFDDTYAPGLAHCSAPAAPAALVVGAECDATIRDVLIAYAHGFEAMAALARASHPDLYARGWHPTAVCGTVGAAVAAALLLGLDEAASRRAQRLAILQAGGMRGAFGSDAKSLQVGMASAAGVRGVRLARAGASVPGGLPLGDGGFESAYGGTWAEPDPSVRAIEENWIKAYPCCLQTHSAIEAADQARSVGRAEGPLVVRVHPLSLQAAPIGIPADQLEAKFSIPYTTAFALLHGPPDVLSFSFYELDEDALGLAAAVSVEADEDLGQSEAVLRTHDGAVFAVSAALGSPARPMNDDQLAAKRRSLTTLPIEELVREEAPAAEVLDAVLAVS